MLVSLCLQGRSHGLIKIQLRELSVVLFPHVLICGPGLLQCGDSNVSVTEGRRGGGVRSPLKLLAGMYVVLPLTWMLCPALQPGQELPFLAKAQHSARM